MAKFFSALISLKEATLDSPCGITVSTSVAETTRTLRIFSYAGDDGPYGAISQMPYLGNINNPFKDVRDTASGSDEFGHGHYKAVTGSNITIKLGASNHSGIYQYTFPEDGTANVVVDVSHVFQPSKEQGLEYKAGSFEMTSSRSYMGTGHYIDRNDTTYKISFCGYFDVDAIGKHALVPDINSLAATNISAATVFESDGKTLNMIKPNQDGKIHRALSNNRIAAVFTFSNTTVISRVGISMNNAKEACENVNAES